MIICLSSPLLVGLYDKDQLIKKYSSQIKTSEILPLYFREILREFDIKNLFFTQGPGSFMSIKVTYLFLKTISIVKNIPFFATDGFAFNENNPIKATGNFYFFKKDGKITTQKMDIKKFKFNLPEQLDKTIFSDNNQPLYILPAVEGIN